MLFLMTAMWAGYSVRACPISETMLEKLNKAQLVFEGIAHSEEANLPEIIRKRNRKWSQANVSIIIDRILMDRVGIDFAEMKNFQEANSLERSYLYIAFKDASDWRVEILLREPTPEIEGMVQEYLALLDQERAGFKPSIAEWLAEKARDPNIRNLALFQLSVNTRITGLADPESVNYVSRVGREELLEILLSEKKYGSFGLRCEDLTGFLRV